MISAPAAIKTTLPKECVGDTRADLEAAGVQFGEDANDFFIHVELPSGWRIVPTDHVMWCDLVDDKDRVRASIFSNEHNAHIGVRRRYSYNQYVPCDETGNAIACRVLSDYYITAITDVGKSIHVIGFRRAKDYPTLDAQRNQATAWLEKNYPDYKNANAYFD